MTKRIVAAFFIALFSMSVLLTPAAFANYNGHNDHNDKWRFADSYQLRYCLKTLEDSRSWNHHNNWNNNWNSHHNDVKFCLNILNDRNDNNHWDNNYWNNGKHWENW